MPTSGVLAVGVRIGRIESCQVTAAIDGIHLVVVGRDVAIFIMGALGMVSTIGTSRLSDHHEHCCLRRTVQVVASEDAARFHYIST